MNPTGIGAPVSLPEPTLRGSATSDIELYPWSSLCCLNPALGLSAWTETFLAPLFFLHVPLDDPMEDGAPGL